MPVPDADDFKPHWRDVLRVHPAAELFPLLKDSAPDEFAELVAGIRDHGLHEPHALPVFEQDHGELSLIDGRNRLDALDALGCRFALHRPRRDSQPSLVVEYPPDDGMDGGTDEIALIRYRFPSDLYDLVVDFNIRRRHLTPADRRDLIAKLLQQNPQRSNRETARLVQTNHHTVGAVRTRMEATGEIPQLTETTGADGRTRRTRTRTATATKPEAAPTTDDADRRVWELSKEAGETLLRYLGEDKCQELIDVLGGPRDANELWHEIGEEVVYQLNEPRSEADERLDVAAERPQIITRLSMLLRLDSGPTLDELVRTIGHANVAVAALPQPTRLALARGFLRVLGLSDADLRPVT